MVFEKRCLDRVAMVTRNYNPFQVRRRGFDNGSTIASSNRNNNNNNTMHTKINIILTIKETQLN